MDITPPTPLLDERVIAMQLRPYQMEALRVLREKHAAGEHRLHVVAPPGSGKTIIGIAFLQSLGLKTLILSPNAAIQGQWIDKYGRATADIVDTFGEVWGKDVRHLISHDIRAATPILSLTYQRLAVRDAADGSMHENVEHLVSLLREQKYSLLILDECHHLLAFWAQVLKEVLTLHPMTVLGLTATPPVDRAAGEQALYMDLVGDVDYQIPLPAVVKDGNLAPFQDLVCLAHPGERERAFIHARHEQFHSLLADLDQSHPTLPPLSMYVQDVLDTLRYRGSRFESWNTLMARLPSVAIAMGRYAREHEIPMPDGCSFVDEMEEALTLDDVVLLLQGYLEDECNPRNEGASIERIALITAALKQLGFEMLDGRFVRRRSAIDRVLALSSAKLAVLRQILSREITNLGDAIRVLVLTDFETAQAGGSRALEGVLDPDAGGAVAVMRCITSDPAIDVLDPVMLTGSSILCDDDLAERFLSEMRSIAAEREWELQLDATFAGEEDFQPGELAGRNDSTRGMFVITGSGRDWDTRSYVLMITELFDRGVTRCLIGTRGLLGEGWDSVAVNVLVDLTAVASYVSVNQMHGRSLRLDPERPEKVANNWDIVAVLPEFERGFADWERFVRKHEHFFGLSDDGELERGIGHVHPLLTHLRPDELATAIPLINEDMLTRSARRAEVFHAWRIGGEYRGVQLPCLEFRPEKQTPRRLAATARNAAQLTRRVEEFTSLSKRLAASAALAPLLSSVPAYLATQAMTTLPALWITLLFSGALALSLSAFRSFRLARFVTTSETQPLDAHLRCIAAAVRDTMVALRGRENDEIPEIFLSDREDGCRRIWIESADHDENEAFTSAMNELFRPVQDQRYLLRTWRVAAGKSFRSIMKSNDGNAWYEESDVVPVPSVFGSKRERADMFHHFWKMHLGKADLLYARRGEGAELLHTHLRARYLGGRRFLKLLWK